MRSVSSRGVDNGGGIYPPLELVDDGVVVVVADVEWDRGVGFQGAVDGIYPPLELVVDGGGGGVDGVVAAVADGVAC